MLKKAVICLSLFLSAISAGAGPLPADIFSAADAGVRAIYNLDFKTANFYINSLLEKYPDYPIALFGKTMIEWSRFEYEYEKSNPEQAKVFESTINASIKGVNTWLSRNKPEAQAYLALGGIYGVKARFELANKHYVRAYFSGRKGIKYMNRAAEMDPKMYDAYLGEGIYQYYAGTLPSVVKVLAKLVVNGSAQKGIDYLNLVKDKGNFSADTAKLLLVQISIESDKYHNPLLATRYINEIRAKYPQNPLFNFVAVIAAYENKQYDAVQEQAHMFLAKIGKEKFYNDIYIARSYTALGTASMAKGNYQKAKEYFESSVAATAKQPLSRWQLWNTLRLAEAMDALGERQEAVEIYKSVLAEKQTWGIDSVAKQRLKTPFKAGTYPGHMSPP